MSTKEEKREAREKGENHRYTSLAGWSRDDVMFYLPIVFVNVTLPSRLCLRLLCGATGLWTPKVTTKVLKLF